MNITTYPFLKRTESHYYEFFSEGPNGSIKKVVEFFRFKEFEVEVFNLAFGDWDESSNRINDMSVSNNDDKQKVLSTVAAIVTDFMADHPHAAIFATGSTPSRTRLYQMGIAKVLVEINSKFEIYGLLDYEWQPFQMEVN